MFQECFQECLEWTKTSTSLYRWLSCTEIQTIPTKINFQQRIVEWQVLFALMISQSRNSTMTIIQDARTQVADTIMLTNSRPFLFYSDLKMTCVAPWNEFKVCTTVSNLFPDLMGHVCGKLIQNQHGWTDFVSRPRSPYLFNPI